MEEQSLDTPEGRRLLAEAMFPVILKVISYKALCGIPQNCILIEAETSK